MQLAGARQRIVTGERVRQGRYRLVQQAEDHMLNRPPQRLRQSFDQDALGSGRGGHSLIPHASESWSRVNVGSSSSGPGSARIRPLATPRPTSRRSRLSSAFSESSSARGC
jgi:hypothetical protein